MPIKDQSKIPFNGHAIECRIYAENPARKFLRAAGTLRHLRIPTGDGVRVDTGVVQGDKISVFYDPMISKLIVHGPDRESAINKLLVSLKSYQVVGTPTNIPFVEKCVDHPAFRKGGVNTSFLERYAEDVKVLDEAPLPSSIGLCLASLSLVLSVEGRVGILDSDVARRMRSPWSNLSGSWRMGVPFQRTLNFAPLGADAKGSASDGQSAVSKSNRDGSYTLLIGEDSYRVQGVLREDGSLEATIDGKHYSVTSVVLDEEDGSKSIHIWAAPGREIGKGGETRCSVCVPSIDRKAATVMEGSGSIKAPMPGRVVRVNFKQGQEIKGGEVLIVLEAMKMEHAILSPNDGILTKISCSPGDLVSDGAILAVVGKE